MTGACSKIALDRAGILWGGPGRASHTEHEHAEAQVTVHLRASAETSGASRSLAWIVPSRVPHAGGWDDGTLSVVFHLSPDLLSATADELLCGSAYELCGGETADPLILHLGQAAAAEIRAGHGGRLLLDSVNHVLAGRLIRRHSRVTARDPGAREALSADQMRRLRDFIEAHFDQPLKVADLGAALRIGPQRLARLLKASNGFSPYGYVTHLRMERARRMLHDPALSLAEIAFRLGFASQSHFTAVFRRYLHVTPKAFRAQVRR